VLIARSLQEAELFVELHPCDCGQGIELDFSLVKRDGRLVAVYQGECSGCGPERRFEFVIPEDSVGGAAYGGPEPSSIIDAGEFLWYSDRAAERAQLTSTTNGETELADARSALDVALAALEEVGKFLPAGADTLPRDAIPSDLGRAVSDANPDRFQRERLGYRKQLLQDAQSQLVHP
jgi:hypothetical protein